MSTSCIAPTTATASATSRPSPRNCGCRARPSTACSTGWSAAITPTKICSVRDNLRFGSQYGAFAACRLVATVSRAGRRCLQSGRAGLPQPAAGAAAGVVAGAGVRRRPAPLILAGARPAEHRSTMSASNGADVYDQNSKNCALFTHNIFNITDQLRADPRPALHQREARSSTPTSTTTTRSARSAGGARRRRSPTPALAADRRRHRQPDLPGQFDARSTRQLDDKRSESEWTGTGVLSLQADRDC